MTNDDQNNYIRIIIINQSSSLLVDFRIALIAHSRTTFFERNQQPLPVHTIISGLKDFLTF